MLKNTFFNFIILSALLILGVVYNVKCFQQHENLKYAMELGLDFEKKKPTKKPVKIRLLPYMSMGI